MSVEPAPPARVSPKVKVTRPGLIVVLVLPVVMLLLYVALSSVLGLLTPVFISPNGAAVYPYVWGLSVRADLDFVIGSILVALLVFIGSRRTGSSLMWLFLWVPLAYLLTFAVYSTADSFTSADGSCAASCAAGKVLVFGQPGLLFASLAPAMLGRRRRVALPPAAYVDPDSAS